MFTIPPKPYVGKNLNILTSKELTNIFLKTCILCENATPSLLYQSRPRRWRGVPTNCTNNGDIIWAIRSPFLGSMSNLSLITYPRTGGIVNAEAIAIMSLKKNNPKEANGKGFFYLAPNFWAKALSLARLAVVLTTKVIISFNMEGSTPETWIWSERLDDM